MDDDIMREKEAAEYLKISPVTIGRWRKEGKIPFSRVGKVIFFSKKALNKAIFGTAKEDPDEKPVSKKRR